MYNKHLSKTRVRQWTTFTLLLLALTTTALLPASVCAQREDPPITPQTRAEIIDSAAQALDTIYVFPEVANQMQSHIRKQLKDGAYNNDSTYSLFLRHLTEDLQDISNDRHLSVRYLSEEILAVLDSDTLADEGKQQDLMRRRRDNFGFKEVKLLPGNVGYVKLNGFSDTEYAGPTAVAAMNLLAYADAVIFDLTDNGGGSPSMIQLLLSYFFEEPTHLNSFYVRATDSIQQFWTQQWVPGPTMYNTNLYVLTSSYKIGRAHV